MSALEPPRARPIAHVYDAAYAGVPNWDIGRPQRAFVRLAEAGFIQGPVLDVGCGTGELSLFLARQGHDVLGDARREEGTIYGVTPGELRRRFGEARGWEVAFAYETGFERRWSTNPAYFVGVRRL